jgi:hypothetical protein
VSTDDAAAKAAAKFEVTALSISQKLKSDPGLAAPADGEAKPRSENGMTQ